MDYPNDFDTPAFPAGKSIALTRSISIWISIIFFLIVCACGLVLYTTHMRGNYPFLISVDPITNEWNVVTYPNKDAKNITPQYQVIQEKLVSDYVMNWFTISKNQKINNQRWQRCEPEDCDLPEQFRPNNIECFLFCNSSTNLFEQFETKVTPEYVARVDERAEEWNVEIKNIMINSVGENGGFWQVYFVVHSTINGPFDVLAFVKTARSVDSHTATLGYYVDDFNAYRMSR
ncbi:MAG: hypothetical protein J6W27_04600 [Alphaproteobacteria bacterium]|nr:hypothetical protein [Alphaproteobacteria bacterium]